jgi:nicotinamide riboside kinase
MATINTALRQYKQQITEIDTDILRAFVYKIIAVEQNEIVFCIAGSKKYTDKEFVERRQDFVNYDPMATGCYSYEKYNQTMNDKVIII